MKRDVVIIGGGIIGLMSAYFLYKAGRKVTVIDENDITDSTSFGNAGLLSAFDKAPLSHPGVIGETFKMMLKGESPVNIHPKFDYKLFRWLLNFAKNANDDRLKKTKTLFEKYGQRTIDLYKQIQEENNLDFDFHHTGMLNIFTENESYEKKLKEYSVEDFDRFEVLNKNQIKDYLPCGNDDIKGVIHFKRNAHLDPQKVMLELKHYLKEQGVEFILNEKILDIGFRNKKVQSVSSRKNSYEANTFIMSTGYQTLLANRRKKELMQTPAKGYSITFKMPEHLKPKAGCLFNDLFIVMTPRRDDVRLTSKLELGSNDPDVVQKQIKSIKENFKRYTIPFEMENEKLWSGFRPLTPNDRPLFGKDDEFDNLIYAMGLGWLGMTFAPSIAKTLENLITNDLKNYQDNDVLLFSGFYQG
ncbi:MAG: NAD(P)/FAD-dependent oxidoreductase [Campylobacterota bacterium]